MNAITTADLFEMGARVGHDPALLVWPPTLPIEIALKTASLPELQLEYGFSDEEWSALRYNPVFLADLARAVETVKEDGMSFKIKAKLQAEELLKRSWRLIHDNTGNTPPSVQADLIKATMRWAGYDDKAAKADNLLATGLNIQINMGT